MAKTKQEILNNIHSEALRIFDGIQSALRDERLLCLQDRRFASITGAQWEGALGEQFSNKPKFEINKIALAIQRIFTEYRNNRISVAFSSKDGAKNDRLADVCAGLYRADEQDSCAEEAYDNAFEEAVTGGFGAWRLRPEYQNPEDPDDERQRIRFEPIFDADSSVFFDLNAKRQDKSDANHCFVLTSMTHDAYKATYNDDPASWPKEISQVEFDWQTPDVVYVADYYRVETVNDEIYVIKAIDGTEFKRMKSDMSEEDFAEINATGSVITKTRKVRRRRVRLMTMSGGGVLEDQGHIAGKHIPVIPVYGKRWFIDNVERCCGHVRLAKDAQRLKNMQMSKLGELAAVSTVEKPIFTPEQMAGHQNMWSEDNVKNYPYLLVNPIMAADGSMQAGGPVAYTKSPAIPPAMAAILQLSEQDIRDVLGNQEQGDKIVSNISGVAVEMVQQRLDMQTFLYVSNMAKAIRRCGEVWLEMAKEIYVEDNREMKTVTAQGEVGAVVLSKPMVDKDTREVVHENDLSTANHDVSVDVGPSFRSQRAAIVKAVTGMMTITTDPDTQRVLQAIALMNMEGEGLRDAREYFRKKLLEIGVVKPTDEEAQAMAEAAANAQPDPNAVFLKAAADEATAKASKARAEVVKTVADTELAKAKAMEIVAGIDMASRDQLLKLIELLVPESKLKENSAPAFDMTASPEIGGQIAGIPQDIQGEFLERLSNQ